MRWWLCDGVPMSGPEPTRLYGAFEDPPSSPRSRRVLTLDERVLRLESAVMDLRTELSDWTGQQRRGNVISLKLQSELQSFKKEIRGGLMAIKRQNELVLKLLNKK